MTYPNMDKLRERHIGLMLKTLDTIKNFTRHLSQSDATTYRDGGDGWTVLEVLCHLRDYDQIFYERAVTIRDAASVPTLPVYDHVGMVTERNYNAQDLHAVVDALASTRPRTAAFYQALTAEQWERHGIHPEREGLFTMTDALMQVGMHDCDHIEQMTRILAERKTAP